MEDKKIKIDPSIATYPFIQFVQQNGGCIDEQNGDYFVHIIDKKSVDKEMRKLSKRLKKERKKIWKTH